MLLTQNLLINLGQVVVLTDPDTSDNIVKSLTKEQLIRPKHFV